MLGFGQGKRNSNSASPYKTTANKKNQISQLQASNIEHKKTIASLKRAQAQTSDEDSDIEDAGNSFGGKSKKAKEKKGLFGRVGELLIALFKLTIFYKYSQLLTINKRRISVFSSNNHRTISKV